jgi:hypothetical protein
MSAGNHPVGCLALPGFSISHRDIEDLLALRGIEVSY